MFLPLVSRTVKGVEHLGQVIKESGVPLAELEAPFKMCAHWILTGKSLVNNPCFPPALSGHVLRCQAPPA